VLFVCASLPGLKVVDDTVMTMNNSSTATTANVLDPLNLGFTHMFRGMSNRQATALSIPATYATAFGFVWAFGRVIASMAESHLFPTYLKQTYGEQKVPYMALITGSILSYILCMVTYFMPILGTYIFNIAILSGFMAYVSQCYGYIILKIRYDNQERLFKSPFGIAGAVFGALVFTIGAISVIGFQNDRQVAFYAFLCQVVVVSGYYYGYARSKQRFSDDEKFVFVAQIVKCKKDIVLLLYSCLLKLLYSCLLELLIKPNRCNFIVAYFVTFATIRINVEFLLNFVGFSFFQYIHAIAFTFF
jgi:amino acid transporter